MRRRHTRLIESCPEPTTRLVILDNVTITFRDSGERKTLFPVVQVRS